MGKRFNPNKAGRGGGIERKVSLRGMIACVRSCMRNTARLCVMDASDTKKKTYRLKSRMLSVLIDQTTLFLETYSETSDLVYR